MGKSAKDTKTTDKTSNTDYASTTNAATTGQSRVDVPDWLLDPAQKQAGMIGGIMGGGAGQFTPQLSGLSQQTAQNVANLNPTGSAYNETADAYRGVGNVTADQVTGQSLLTNLKDYENPYKEQVLNPVLTDYDVNSGKVRAAQAAQGARGAFGGSRFGVREGETEGNLSRGRAATEGGLLNQMFDTSTRLSGEDAGRRQQAMLANQSANLQAGQGNQRAMLDRASGLGKVAGATQGDIRETLGLQGQVGGQLTDFENAQRQYPLQFAQTTGGLLGQLNPGQYFGQSQQGTSASNTVGSQDTTSHEKEVSKSNPGLLGTIGGVMDLAKSGMGLMSGMGLPGMLAGGGIQLAGGANGGYGANLWD